MSIFVSLLTAGTNSHEETSENFNAVATDFVSEGVIGAITNTSGVAPMTGAFAVNAQGTPDMTVKVSSGVAYVQGTPTSQDSQMLRVRMSADTNVTISANTSGSTKYDWVYIKLDADKMAAPGVDADDVATLVTSRSSNSSSDNGTPPTYGHPIAVVTVANSASSITNASIADKRVLATSVQDNSVDSDALVDKAVPGAKIASYRIPYQAITTNTTDTADIIQSGWSYIQGSGGNTGTKTITFPTAFTTIKSVHITPLGLTSGSAPTAIGDFTTGYNGNNAMLYAKSITTTTFTANYTIDSSATLASTLYTGFSWIAIGT